MSTLKQERILLREAEAAAIDLVAEFMAYCHEIKVAGSIRRQRPDIGDIDLVAIPVVHEMPVTDMFGTVLSTSAVLETSKRLVEMEDEGIVKISKTGGQIASFTCWGIACDLYYATEETFPMIFLVRTGSKNWNRFLASVAIGQGKKFKADGQGVTYQGERIGHLSEGHILEALGLPFIPPEEREVPESALRGAEMQRYYEHFKRHRKTLLKEGR